MLKMHPADRAGFFSERMVDLHNAALANDWFELITTEHALKIAALITDGLPLDNVQTIDRCFLDIETAHALI
jgi:ribosome biogenesis SPOUT family RNA methylase Rps3